ncbi:MAG: hypothetical protein IKO55_12115, partial [Kiritimatiellae bacterium]|nr:hypothetical protein [Kiritimatiellia bacterium]
MCTAICFLAAILPARSHSALVTNMTVRTRAANNPAPKVWYRVPEGYKATKGRTWRTLVIFGGRNCAGSNEVSNVIGWARWADRHGVFLVAPGFKDDKYREPQAWSGRALLNALSEIRKSYDINTSKLLYYGYSAGSQAANLFAAWRPDLCRAWVSHACGVFHEPSARMKGAPGLVTCGDADAVRDILSRDFVAKARKVGQPVIWKSFPNHPHDVPPGSLALARAFLGHWHEIRCGELGEAVAQERDPLGKIRDKRGPPGFVGDEPEGVYWPVESPEAASVPPDDRVELPSRAIAEAWGQEGMNGRDARSPSTRVAENGWDARFSVEGIPFICRAPEAYTPDSRVAVLFGGRDWSAEKTLSVFGFDGVADSNGLFIVSPSFACDDYWRPESGTGRIVCRAIDAVRRRHDLKPNPVILYGYSAGGQCAALFSDWMKGEVAAWGAHGCGVYSETNAPPFAPALVTCGEGDEDRLRISRRFAYARREAGG